MNNYQISEYRYIVISQPFNVADLMGNLANWAGVWYHNVSMWQLWWVIWLIGQRCDITTFHLIALEQESLWTFSKLNNSAKRS